MFPAPRSFPAHGAARLWTGKGVLVQDLRDSGYCGGRLFLNWVSLYLR